MSRLVFLIATFVALIAISASQKRVVCYYGSWAVYRQGNGQFDIEYIDPSLCTHLIYTFVGLENNDIRVLDPWQDLEDDYGKDGYNRFNALRKQNPNVKTMVAIGGWNEGSEKYSQMARTAESRERFAKNALAFVKKYNFDGFDVDWEYPAQRGGSPNDKANYIELLKALRKEFQNVLLSAAVSAAKPSASQSYNIPEMSKHLDFINIMAYDLHGGWESKTGMNAQLKPAAGESGDDLELNVLACVNYWLSSGAPKEKLNLGVPFYGRAFTLSDVKDTRVGAAASGPGLSGPYTQEAGMLGYNEICEMHLKEDWNIFFDEERRVPYAHKNNQWIGFDNTKSMQEKAELILELDLGGAMIWSIETDDFKGICGEKYPLLKILNTVLNGKSNGKPSPTLPPTTTTTEKKTSTSSSTTSSPTTSNPTTSSSSSVCTEAGHFKDPNSCGFIECVGNGNGGFFEYYLDCPASTCWNDSIKTCNWSK